jgi:hypothetical protein
MIDMTNRTPHDYMKVQHGKRWLLCRPIIGSPNSYKTVATFDAECELDNLLAAQERATFRSVAAGK